ncbi:hypothetical protein DFH27DRAFT_173308 [Peziza echinospora]|nr:hypothetical protein DFH27DRAFT_173308 [Peziza echinospora]
MTMDYENERGAYEDSRDYPSRDDRSPSPRGARSDSPRRDRRRSVSPGARPRDERAPPSESRAMDASSTTSAQGNGSEARNTGTNLFVTGIHPRLTEEDVTRLFSKYGEVEKCQIMVDPHTKESRGFGFVKLSTLEQADAAKEGLQGEEFEGRVLSIEKARRNRPRTPTPGKYFGPPKRGEVDDFRRAPPRGGYEDRRYGGRSHGSGGRYDDDRYSSRYDDRASGDRYYRSRESRDDYPPPPPRGIDRYASSGREDRYSSRGEDRRSYYDRDGGREGAYSSRSAGGSAVDDRAPVAASSGRDYYRDEPRGDREAYSRR